MGYNSIADNTGLSIRFARPVWRLWLYPNFWSLNTI